MQDTMSGSLFLDERVLDRAHSAAEAPAIGVPGRWYTYGDLARRVERLTASLQAHGAGPDTFVLNMLPNGIDSVAAGLAIQRSGACVVEVNREWGAAFIGGVARSTRARYGFLHRKDTAILGESGDQWRALWLVGDESPNAAAAAAPKAAQVVAIDERGTPGDAGDGPRDVHRTAEDLAVLMFTSASTGPPRGVMLSYRNIAANTESIVECLRLGPADRVMSILPLSYCYGRSLLQTHLWAGGSIFFDHRFMYPRSVLGAIAGERCTGFAGVPFTFEVLRRKCDPRLVPMPSLRYVTQAGGGMATQLRGWVRDAFAPADFFVMYGQTEATARLACLPPARFLEKPAAIGIPIPGVELRVVDDESRDVGVEVVGNLIARGDNVTRGYFEAPEDTRAILRDGWLWTGDLARRDADGYFFVEGRKRVMLKVRGHRFSPVDVEDRLTQHPAVAEACVVGVPDPVSGEAVCAFVVVDQPVDALELRRFCAEALPTFKVPRQITMLDSLPHSPAGKVRRVELEKRARQSADQSIGVESEHSHAELTTI
jgi:acyl-CoA synthetase (AMP-forming)/AMP-acid ligase II